MLIDFVQYIVKMWKYKFNLNQIDLIWYKFNKYVFINIKVYICNYDYKGLLFKMKE